MSTLLSIEALRRHSVVNESGKKLGQVEDFMFDPESGEVRYLIMSFGGVLGLGERHFAIPYDVVEIDPSKERIIFRFDTEELKRAPGFTRDQWPNFAPAYRKDIEGFYEALQKARKKK